MTIRRTRADLESAIADLEPYREAFWAIQRGEKPVKYTSGEWSVWLLGASRACGGVVLLNPEGTCVHYAERWASPGRGMAAPLMSRIRTRRWQSNLVAGWARAMCWVNSRDWKSDRQEDRACRLLAFWHSGCVLRARTQERVVRVNFNPPPGKGVTHLI
jgi:hypothetical protein